MISLTMAKLVMAALFSNRQVGITIRDAINQRKQEEDDSLVVM